MSEGVMYIKGNLTKANKLPGVRFTYENSAIRMSIPQTGVVTDDFNYTLPGWEILGWCHSKDVQCRPRETGVSVMFECISETDYGMPGEKCWIHFIDGMLLDEDDEMLT